MFLAPRAKLETLQYLKFFGRNFHAKLVFISGTQILVEGATDVLGQVTDVVDPTEELSETVTSVSDGVDTIVDTTQTSLDEIDITDVDSILDEAGDIVEGVTTGVGQITDTLDVTQLDELTETVCILVIIIKFHWSTHWLMMYHYPNLLFLLIKVAPFASELKFSGLSACDF